MDRIRLDGAGRRLMRAVAIMAATQAVCQADWQTVIYVDDDAPAGGHGRNWDFAFDDLQDALDLAKSSGGDIEIRIAEGQYIPSHTGDRDESFKLDFGGQSGSGMILALKGGFAGIGRIGDPNRRDVHAYETVISGDLNGDDGPGFTNRDENSRLLLFSQWGAFGDDEFLIIDGITFRGASAEIGEIGGALIGFSAHLFLVRCRFEDCQSETTPAVFSSGSITTTHCVFRDCIALSPTGSIIEAGLSLILQNSVVMSNTGRGISAAFTSLNQSTIVGNSGAGVRSLLLLSITNSIVYGNGNGPTLGDQIITGPGQFYPRNSILQGWIGSGETGVSGADPRFVDDIGPDGVARSGDEDLRLLSNSPAVDTGDLDLLGWDWADLDNDGDYNEDIPIDLAGNPRVVGPSVDMGAYEFQICPADLTATSDPADPRYGIPDGMVTMDDFFVFLDLFSAGDPRADLTGSFNPSSPAFGIPDGRFDATDFFAYLTAFELGCP